MGQKQWRSLRKGIAKDNFKVIPKHMYYWIRFISIQLGVPSITFNLTQSILIMGESAIENIASKAM